MYGVGPSLKDKTKVCSYLRLRFTITDDPTIFFEEKERNFIEEREIAKPSLMVIKQHVTLEEITEGIKVNSKELLKKANVKDNLIKAIKDIPHD